MVTRLRTLQRPEPFGERVYATLRDYLRAGRIRAGQPLQEGVLAARLGVSRTPVREALARLASEGLVVADGRSFTLPSLSVADIEDIYALQFLLEPQALRLIAESRPGRKGLVPLRKAFEDMSAAHAAGDGAEFMEAVRAQFGDDVPAAVGAVQRPGRRVAAQCRDHRVDAVALHGDDHERADVMVVHLRPEPHRVADDRAVLLETGDAVLHRAPGDADLLGERGDRGAGVFPQQGEQGGGRCCPWHSSRREGLTNTPVKAVVLTKLASELYRILAFLWRGSGQHCILSGESSPRTRATRGVAPFQRPAPGEMYMVDFTGIERVRELVNRAGTAAFIEALAGEIEADYRRWHEFDKSPRHAVHSPVGVIELMPIPPKTGTSAPSSPRLWHQKLTFCSHLSTTMKSL